MKRPRVLVLSGYGINCEDETTYAFNLPTVGGEAYQIHLSDLIAQPQRLEDFHILVVPGGFAFGDDIAAGIVLATKLRYRLERPLDKFLHNGNLVLGICNGFQALVRLGVLPAVAGVQSRYVMVKGSLCHETMAFSRPYMLITRSLRAIVGLMGGQRHIRGILMAQWAILRQYVTPAAASSDSCHTQKPMCTARTIHAGRVKSCRRRAWVYSSFAMRLRSPVPICCRYPPLSYSATLEPMSEQW
jgi:CobB/CobQ-like glutamine amidotransferase domain